MRLSIKSILLLHDSSRLIENRLICLFIITIVSGNIFGQREHVSSEKMRFDIYDARFLDSEDGRIIPNITIGFRPFTYNWIGPDGFTSTDSILFNVKPGEYHLYMEDQLCGKFSDVFEIKAIQNDFQKFSGVKIEQISPNPFHDRISIKINSNANHKTHLRIINTNSQLVHSSQMILNQGEQEIVLDKLKFRTGIYILQICIDDKCLLSDRIIKIE